MFHNLLWRAPAIEYKDTSNTQGIVHCCQALKWHEQFLSIHLDEIIPANPLITGCLFQIQNSLPDTWGFAVLHYRECIDASVIRENYSLSFHFWKGYGIGSKRNGQDDGFNTCEVEHSRNEGEDQQDLYHQVKSTNQASMLLALSEAQEGEH